MAGDWGAGGHWRALLLAILLTTGLGALVGLGLALWFDIKFGLIKNELGLCKGDTLDPAGPEGPHPGLSEWLHAGIQRSAGLELTDRPLTFRDLWSAPAYPGAQSNHCADSAPAGQRSINLQMITTNVTHGRPYRLPLADETSRLFFKPEELRPYLPAQAFDALLKAALPYAQLDKNADPKPGPGTLEYLELPGAELPVLVAARLSLSFPLLFSAVPLYAIDYAVPRAARNLKRCLFSDGGVSSNFPIHLFDAALPRWPTFGFWLDRQDPHRPGDAVWLPEFHRQGWGDNWSRFDPAAAAVPAASAATTAAAAARPKTPTLAGYLVALASNALNWRDRTSLRLPHVRNRVARLLLRPGEGGLNIGMPRDQILLMAHRYGTAAAKLFVKHFAERHGTESPAWREQRWVRLHLLVNGLRERLSGLSASVAYTAHSVPMHEAIERALCEAPLRELDPSPELTQAQAKSLGELLAELERLEAVLHAAEPQDYKPTPAP